MVMKILFVFFLRLFFCLLAAKFVLRFLGADSLPYLLALTLLLVANIYWFDFLDFREFKYGRRRERRELWKP
jgi:hypothetical protein